MTTTLRAAAPFSVGQLVTVQRGRDLFPGTVVDLRHHDRGFEVRVQVLTSFGVGISRHVVDGNGRDLDDRLDSIVLRGMAASE